MNAVRANDPPDIRPLHVVMICLVVMTVGGSSWLLSAAKPTAPVDGAIEWHEESPLRAVVQLLCLNYQAPTHYAGEVKNYILGIGAGLGLLALSIAVVAKARTIEEDQPTDDEGLSSGPLPTAEGKHAWHRLHIPPLVAAEVLIGFYLLWSFASSRWSSAPELAVGASILLTIGFLWAFVVGNGLSSLAARFASQVIVAITAVTAVVAIWYHYGRNPTLRADFPVGNPTFLAACLIPGILLAIALACEKIASAVKTRRAKPIVFVILPCAAIIVSLWAFYLAGSRGPFVSLLLGALAMAFFALRGRLKLMPVIVVVGVVLSAWMYYSRGVDAFSPTNRSATLRLRTYACSYAWRMFNEKPFRGHGQGGFVLAGDTYAADDVLNDPLVFESRIAHAHNEWLEVMADLGSVGIVLVTVALLLTLRAGMVTLSASPDRGQRWALIACLGSLVGLTVEECFGVGLRVSGVPTLFYTVLGLTWALSGCPVPRFSRRVFATRPRRIITAAVGGSVGLVALGVTQQDFTAARQSYQAEEALLREEFDEAIRLAKHGINRLNPQRALTNLYRVTETHLRAAQHLQSRAQGRQRRANETEPPNPRLMSYALDDYRRSEEHCEKGSGWLKELVRRSPGFINHGRLEYWLNLTRAGNVRLGRTRNDAEKQEALLTNAMVAVERELSRQPFDPLIAVDYMRLAATRLDLDKVIDVFARPLRNHRIGASYVELLRQLTSDPTFDQHFEPLIQEAKLAATSPLIGKQADEVDETWAPEKLRLAATVRFIRGDYQGARDLLEWASAPYDRLAEIAPLGAASCYAELADCRFYSNPNDPFQALTSATRALTLVPASFHGRQLRASVRTRMVDYYLAAGNEDDAKRLLRETRPPGATEQDVLHELGARYRRMCESLLGRREAGEALRKPPVELLPKLHQWIGRAVELNPEDPFAHYLAADLAFYAGDDEATVGHLQQAVSNGLSADLAIQFLQFALNKKPESGSLTSFLAALGPTKTSKQSSPPP